jgi:hypothetical protein
VSFDYSYQLEISGNQQLVVRVLPERPSWLCCLRSKNVFHLLYIDLVNERSFVRTTEFSCLYIIWRDEQLTISGSFSVQEYSNGISNHTCSTHLNCDGLEHNLLEEQKSDKLSSCASILISLPIPKQLLTLVRTILFTYWNIMYVL